MQPFKNLFQNRLVGRHVCYNQGNIPVAAALHDKRPYPMPCRKALLPDGTGTDRAQVLPEDSLPDRTLKKIASQRD